MSINVHDAMNLSVFRDCELLAGTHGMDNIIYWVNILELLDDVSLLHEGDLLITSAFNLENDPQTMDNLIPYLSDIRLAAIAIQTGYYLDEIPQKIIDQCNHYNLPLIRLPKSASFSEITKAVLKQVINKQIIMLEYAQQVNAQFTQVILESSGLSKIARVLSEIIHCPVRILDNDFNLLSFHGMEENSCLILPEQLQEEYLYLKKNNLFDCCHSRGPITISCSENPDVPFQWIAPLNAGNKILGYVTAVPIETNLSEIDLCAFSSAATVSALEMIKEMAILETEQKISGDFLSDLIEGNNQSRPRLYRQAQHLGFNKNMNYTALVISIDNFASLNDSKTDYEIQETKRRLFSLLYFHTCTQTQHRIVLSQQNDYFTLLLQVAPQHSTQDIEKIARTLQEKTTAKMDLSISIGIGKSYPDLFQVPESFREATQALQMGKVLHKKSSIISYEQLGIYSLLLGSNNLTELRKFYNTTIGLLATHDAQHKAELVKTLDYFIKNNGELQRTADALFIHRHTLKYRMQRIHEISKCNPYSYQDRFHLQLGLIIANLLASTDKTEDTIH
ncbi:MAG: sugar diacid utilization regulator [Firmicutes bacterium]|nr:sugar diacid utilization regulator [Bacillota bacterium]